MQLLAVGGLSRNRPRFSCFCPGPRKRDRDRLAGTCCIRKIKQPLPTFRICGISVAAANSVRPNVGLCSASYFLLLVSRSLLLCSLLLVSSQPCLLSISIYLYIPLFLSLSLYIRPSIYLSFCLSLSFSVYLFVFISFFLSL